MVRLGLPTRLKSYNGKNGDAAQSESRSASPGRSPTEAKGLVLKTRVIRVSAPGSPSFVPSVKLIMVRSRHEIYRRRTKAALVIQ